MFFAADIKANVTVGFKEKYDATLLWVCATPIASPQQTSKSNIY